MKRLTFLATAVFALALAFPVQASQVYEVTEAHNDQWGMHGDGHAFWFPGLSTDLVFTQPGKFVDHGDHWTLEGHVQSKSNSSIQFDVHMNFVNIGAPDGPIKLELKSDAYAANGGPVDPSSWKFSNGEETCWRSGRCHTVVGKLVASPNSKYAGTTLKLLRRGPAAQLGKGANGKNAEHGLSSWLYAKGRLKYMDDHGRWKKKWVKYHGDINVNLRRPVPEPTSAVLFSCGALLVSAALRRRG